VRSAKLVARSAGYGRLVTAIEVATRDLVGRAAAGVNEALVMRNWMVGHYLGEYEQDGADRARYGARLLERLAGDLSDRGIKGLDARTLRDCRTLYEVYPQIRGPVDPELGTGVGPPFRGPADPKSSAHLPASLPMSALRRLSWSHLVHLISIDEPWKRAFYENEILQGNWSKRQLQRQIESLLYERTGLSTDKRAVIDRARRQGAAPTETVAELIRDPYILEFAGLAERAEYSENDLEAALLDHLQRFLLELGTGFCFEARQLRITVNRKHSRVDLVFYHRGLRCHVLLDLKIRAFRPADAGQMNFYVNWFKAHMMNEGDQPPVGIILCSAKDHTEVEFAKAGMDNRLFVSRYLTALPSADQLRTLVERDRAQLEARRPRAGKGKR